MAKVQQKLTASAPDVSVDSGNAVIIKGTITDASPGLKDTSIATRFPNGVAAVSDASQSAWMLYVWKQFEAPNNATGVPLTVSVIDSNGNYRTIGTTTSDSLGSYSFSWVPDIAGKYAVYVTFAGSNAYYGSTAANSFVVNEAHPTEVPTATPTQSVSDLYFVPAIAGLLVAIIVIGLVLALLIMKKRA